MIKFYLHASLALLGIMGIQDIYAQGSAGGPINIAPDGTKQLYSRDSEGFYSDWGQRVYGSREGGISIIDGDDGFVYIHNAVAGYATNTYLKGIREGNQIIMELPQLLYQEPDFETGEMLYFEAAILENTSVSASMYNYRMSDESRLIYAVGEDGTLSFDLGSEGENSQFPSKIFGLISTTGIFYAGDVSQTLTPVDYTQVSPPENLELTDWIIIDDGTGDDHNVSIGFDGNDVYLYNFDNIYAPRSWIKGTVDGDVVSFPTEQFLGEYNGFFYWYLASDYYETQSTYSFEPIASVDFEYNREKMMMTTTPHASMVANPRKEKIGLDYPEFMWYESPVIKMRSETPSSYTPQNPRLISYVDYYQVLGYNYCEFGIYPLSTDYDVLDWDNLYFHLYINGVAQEVLHSDGDFDFPFNYFGETEDYILVQSFGGNVGLFLMMDGVETIGIELFNVGPDDEIYSSELVTYNVETGEVTVGDPGSVESLYEGEVVGTEYYNLSGHKLLNPQTGLVIERQRYSNGSVKTRKVMLK